MEKKPHTLGIASFAGTEEGRGGEGIGRETREARRRREGKKISGETGTGDKTREGMGEKDFREHAGADKKFLSSFTLRLFRACRQNGPKVKWWCRQCRTHLHTNCFVSWHDNWEERQELEARYDDTNGDDNGDDGGNDFYVDHDDDDNDNNDREEGRRKRKRRGDDADADAVCEDNSIDRVEQLNIDTVFGT
eukprot:151101-Hanusia_phi.AAC.3